MGKVFVEYIVFYCVVLVFILDKNFLFTLIGRRESMVMRLLLLEKYDYCIKLFINF